MTFDFSMLTERFASHGANGRIEPRITATNLDCLLQPEHWGKYLENRASPRSPGGHENS